MPRREIALGIGFSARPVEKTGTWDFYLMGDCVASAFPGDWGWSLKLHDTLMLQIVEDIVKFLRKEAQCLY